MEKILEKRSHHELRKPEHPFSFYETCGTATISSFPSRERCTVPQFIVFFLTVARVGILASGVPTDFSFSITYRSEALLESGVNTERPVTRRVVVLGAMS